MISGGLAASCAAQSATAASNAVGGHDAVDDPQPVRLVGVDALAEQQQLGHLLAADVAPDQHGDHEREQADVDLRRAERRALAGSTRSQASASPSAPASTCPLAAQMTGLPSRPMSENTRGKRSLASWRCDERHLGGEAGQVAAAGEDRRVRRGEHDAAHGVVVARGGERVEQLVEQRVGEGVARLVLVQRDRRHRVGDVVAQLSYGTRAIYLRPMLRAECTDRVGCAGF